MTPNSNLVAEVAVADTQVERAKKHATVSDERTANSRRGLPGSKGEFAQHHAGTREINMSGAQVIVALAAAFSLAGVFWAFVRYWLFAP
jgi:hypothetical protein